MVLRHRLERHGHRHKNISSLYLHSEGNAFRNTALRLNFIQHSGKSSTYQLNASLLYYRKECRSIWHTCKSLSTFLDAYSARRVAAEGVVVADVRLLVKSIRLPHLV